MTTTTTTTTTQRLTYDDLDFVPQERAGDRHELFNGELVVTPSPVPVHQIGSDNVVHALNAIVRPNRLGRVFAAPIDVKFTPTIVAVPDVVFVRRDRLGIIGPKAIEGSPDLIVEILSPSTRHRDLGTKKTLYERFGVREYWIVAPKTRTVSVSVLGVDRYQSLPAEGNIVRSTVLPGVTLDVTTLFADL